MPIVVRKGNLSDPRPKRSDAVKDIENLRKRRKKVANLVRDIRKGHHAKGLKSRHYTLYQKAYCRRFKDIYEIEGRCTADDYLFRSVAMREKLKAENEDEKNDNRIAFSRYALVWGICYQILKNGEM